jgi:VIT1/CCC1 family predicted Fe2+/Mn2+ transporter
MVVSGLAGLVAGACSMAIGEFVSVFSQRDSELADVEKERQVL